MRSMCDTKDNFLDSLFADADQGVCSNGDHQIRMGNTRSMNPYWRRYDFEICNGTRALKHVLSEINVKGWVIASVTQFGHVYTVVFKRFD